MRVLLLEREQARYAELLRTAEPGLELHHDAARAGECPVWLGEPDLLLPLLRQGRRPDWLQSTWAGITPLLGVGLPRDYRLSRAVGIFGQPMAEYVLAYLLLHRRRVLARLASQVEQRWDGQPPPSLNGCKVLVVGAGDIGSEIARFLAPFGVALRGIARQSRPIEPFAEVHGLDELAEQAAWADCIVNVLPDTPATRDLYDADLFARMRREALLINCGRGVAVVDADLVAALQAGQLAGAVIDVCREEPLPPGHPFWDAPRLLLTGHSSAPTEPAAMARLFIDNLRRYRDGQPLRGEVDFARGY
ncbi:MULTISPECIES: D-2-hydroxyacid dehydrogenase [unclassified Pseudomonas]|uniref:D-2-hydroxyacid dehydrogenase n=1 Tax=unclassified Pseudomonas TaxID=196821 RepID=UPI00244CDE88|nr:MULTISPECIES: D-2-hydroxyacid dehydrogenase [unclassified Pseudomonas]MDH0893043.1 D-2-hydroxyacid dehydrogenase [Pseudomonas sp. GD03875]MDH1066198.1 D-2-hydroxyacid dehydrogenase [Pseudomonas sp. GD03985]